MKGVQGVNRDVPAPPEPARCPPPLRRRNRKLPGVWADVTSATRVKRERWRPQRRRSCCGSGSWSCRRGGTDRGWPGGIPPLRTAAPRLGSAAERCLRLPAAPAGRGAIWCGTERCGSETGRAQHLAPAVLGAVAVPGQPAGAAAAQPGRPRHQPAAPHPGTAQRPQDALSPAPLRGRGRRRSPQRPLRQPPRSLTRLELSRCLIPTPGSAAGPCLSFSTSLSAALTPLKVTICSTSPPITPEESVSGFLNIDDMDIGRAAPDLEGLELFVLHGSVITDSAVDFIRRHMRRLRFLEIRSARSLTNAGLDHLTSPRHLETLGLDLSDRISLGAVIALCQALPQLRKLKLAIPHSADEVRARIQESLPTVALHVMPYAEQMSIYFTE